MQLQISGVLLAVVLGLQLMAAGPAYSQVNLSRTSITVYKTPT